MITSHDDIVEQEPFKNLVSMASSRPASRQNKDLTN